MIFPNSQFDTFSGAGFTSSQIANSAPSPANSRDTQETVPVTVKQINESYQSGDEKSNFVIDGVDITNVTVVGMVFNKNARSSDIRFHLDDGTGRVECIRWVADKIDTSEMDAFEEGTYVRVSGHLQSFQNKKQLSAFSMRLVTNFDEVTCHFLECIYFHLQIFNPQSQGSALASQMANLSFSTPVLGASNGVSNGNQPSLTNDFSMPNNADGNLQECNDREMGVHVEELSQQLKTPIEKIKDAIEFLEKEGLVYSSIDDNHFKAVEGC